MLQGELDRIDVELARMSVQRASVAKAREACERSLAYMAGRHVPGLPTVSAHREYGRRGDLQRFLASTLRDTFPVRSSTSELAELALAHFGLVMSSAAELYDFKTSTVGRSLRRLQKLGVIERLSTPHRVKRALGTWQWAQPDMSLDGLRCSQAARTDEEAVWPSQ
ncbi:MAG: hypothetical protein V4508_19100 [Pseudomonadota bacterium]